MAGDKEVRFLRVLADDGYFNPLTRSSVLKTGSRDPKAESRKPKADKEPKADRR